MSILILVGFSGTAYAGLPKCYGVSDTSAKMWFMVPDPGASPLPGMQQIDLPKAHRAEGSAYRPSNQKMYLFDCAGDNVGPCDLREYTIDVAAGTTTHNVLKTNVIRHPDGTADNGRSVEGATFFIDDINGQEYLFATAGERDSTTDANSGRLYKYNTTSWDLEPGYPLEISGDVGSITGLAYDPITDKYYGTQDYTSSDGSSNNADIYEIDLATGITTFVQEMSLATDSEGLTYAADGLLYTEEDQGASGLGRKILTLDMSDGSMLLAASFDGSSGDAESLACNAGEKTDMGDLPGSYGYAAHTIPVFSTTPNPMYMGTVPGDDDFGTANNGVAGKGDDIDDANDDEDGVTHAGESISDMAVLQGATYGLDIVTHGNGYLSAWFDWNNDGDFDDAGEQVAADLDGSSGSILHNVTIPATTADGVLFSRFRYSSDTGLGPNDDVSNGNWASDGEAEDYRLFVNPQMDVVKTSTPDHTPVKPGDTISYKVTVNNPSSLITLHNIVVADPVPVGTNYLPGSAQVTFWDIENGTYFDSVSTSQQYSESHGTLDWTASPWQEINDGGSPTGGDIQILVDPAIGGIYVIQIKDNDKGIQRTADLSAYAAATLSLDYRRDDRNNSNGAVVIEASVDGVTWDPIPLAAITVDGDDAGYLHVEYDITDKISATTTIRFISDGLLDNDDRVYFDNILLTGTNKVKKTIPTHAPANLTIASDGYTIFPGDELSVTFSVFVNDPVLAAISEIENTVSVTAQEIVEPKASTVKDLLVTGSIGDFVWNDQDGDGVQDGGEPGLSGVTVFLDLNANGTLDAGEPSDVTAANGAYDFTGLTAGTYSVQVDNSTIPSGFNLSGGTDPVSVTLAAGQDYNNADFGYQLQNASIGNYVWHDDNSDGIQDAEESGIAGVIVELFNDVGTPIDSMTTDGNGFYHFSSLVAGIYEIKFTAPAGYNFTTENQGSGVLQDSFDSDANLVTGRTGIFSLTAGENNEILDAGMTLDNGDQPASLGDRVWYDSNNNGIQDVAEPGLSGVSVNLYDNNGAVLLASMVTNGNGDYLFNGLAAASYTLEFIAPPGFTISQQDQGTDDALDSDADHVTGLTIAVPLVAGESNGDLDAGMFMPNTRPASLSDRVWYDTNNNGIQDTGEVGIGGVIVTLYAAADQTKSLASATTDSLGHYSFQGLVPGDYVIHFAATAGHVISPVDQGSNDAVDSDADPVSGFSMPFTLVDGDNNVDADVGMLVLNVSPLTIGDMVWLDANHNDTPDASEGLPSAEVVLYDSLGNELARTTTDTNGAYSFVDLTPGDYRVEVDISTLPVNIIQITDPDAVLDSATDIVGLAADDDTLDFGYEQFVNISLNVDISLNKEVSAGPYTVGDMVTFTIAVSNSGPNNATGVVVQDVVPDGYSGITNVSSGGVLQNSTITWSGLNIANGATMSLYFDAVIEANGEHNNTAQVAASDQNDLDSSPDNDDGDQSEDDEDSANVVPMPILPGGNARPIPTLSEWMLIFMSVMLALIGWSRMKQQKAGRKI